MEESETVMIDGDADRVLRTMEEHRIHLVPVIDNQCLGGKISQADFARHLPEDKVGQFVEVICAAL